MVDALRWMPIALSMRRLRRVLTVLLTALVLVQTVGVMHRVAHAQQSVGVTSHAVTHTSSLLTAIWGEHSNSAECQLFDQTCPDLLHTLVWALPVTLHVITWVAAALQERFALFERFYATRGPPVALI
jgi:hypothetical protein